MTHYFIKSLSVIWSFFPLNFRIGIVHYNLKVLLKNNYNKRVVFMFMMKSLKMLQEEEG